MKKILTSLVLLSLLFALFTGCGKAKDDSVIRVVLDWTPNTNHTGLYVAQELGYFTEQGLSVEIIQPPESGALSLVAAGKAEFAVSFQEEMGPAIAQDDPLPITAVAAVINHNTSGIISLKDSGITSPKDLEGKRVASWDSPLVHNIVRSVVEGDGGDFDKVEFIYNNVSDVVSALESDIDAVWVFYAWDGLAVQLAGLDVNYFDFISYDPTFDYYTPVLVAGDSFLAQHPDKAKQFLAAVSAGYDYAIANPEQAGKILKKQAPEIDEALITAGQAYLAEQYQADAPRWGEIDPARWTAFYQWMFQQQLLDNDISEKGFTNEYLPAQ